MKTNKTKHIKSYVPFYRDIIISLLILNSYFKNIGKVSCTLIKTKIKPQNISFGEVSYLISLSSQRIVFNMPIAAREGGKAEPPRYSLIL